MKRPNFFIIGAPKCGTSSLAIWLREHPRIYIPSMKELHFFNTDHPYFGIRSLDRYETLFKKASVEHIAVGEASVWYLYSREAVPGILQYAPDARLIVCLRNPVEMVYSLHNQMLLSQYEDERNFENAWRLQEMRRRGLRIPKRCAEPLYLAYAHACALGKQLERLYKIAGRERVLTIILDDLRENPRQEYLKVLRHLSVEDDGRAEFPVINAARELRAKRLEDVILGMGAAKRRLGIQLSFGLLTAVERLNMRPSTRPPLSVRVRKDLQRHFEPEIEKLGRLLDRNFLGWLGQ